MLYSKPTSEIIRERFSCRNYLEKPIAPEERKSLADFLSAHERGPLGAKVRFKFVAATEQDRQALKGLGTYGFIKNPAGFIVGAVEDTGKGLEDFGYLMELAILRVTDLGLGTCWLGGSFTKGRFARLIGAQRGEQVPAVTSVGYMDDERTGVNQAIRQRAVSDHRLPWEKLFFSDLFGVPLSAEMAEAYAVPLEMVRLGPSATNKQPWRIVQDGSLYHFYLRRTKGYRNRWAARLLNIADLQRLDMGIAMCHFELTAEELDLRGKWEIEEPAIAKPDDLVEYVVSWVREC